jgi:formate hydrogenlyase subunit 6/NADH:ubiquinone oxidoreductase subunit I/glycine cleavage system H lipoate-binding protein
MARFLSTTIKNLFTAPATRAYPFEKREPFPRARGHLEIAIDSCSFCGLCAKKCPARAIEVDRANKQWTLLGFQCIICEACVDVCPKKALEVQNVYRAPQEVKQLEIYSPGMKPVTLNCASKQVGEFVLHSRVYYYPGHTWAKVDGNKVRIGLDDFASRIIGDVKVAKSRQAGDILAQGKVAVESPLYGRILKVNENLSLDTASLKKDPYGDGWLYEMEALNPYEDFKSLLFGYGAEAWLKGDIDSLHRSLEKDLGATMADGGQLGENLPERLSLENWKEMTRRFFRT